jgi:hypothetical protein
MAHVNSTTANIQKPTQVKSAISLLYVYAVISILIDSTLSILREGFSIGSLVLATTFFLVNVFLVFMISKGKTWPRNLLLVFLLFGLCSILYYLPNVKAGFRYQFIIMGIKFALGVIPIIVLYLKPAKQWFETFR